ncbi:hypothetical protein JCM6882_006611 [Rhodosporidiobolus microsporus]
MSDAPPASALSSGVASRFVSSTALDEAKKKREEEWKEAYARMGQEPPKELMQQEETYDPRSLYERLQDNKNKKQEAFEEQLKFKNHFRSLDEDEVSFLDSMVDETNEEEKERQRQIKEELQGFRAAVTKRGAPPPPPGASPPLRTSTSSASPSTSAAASSATASKPAATAPKKGKKKTLAGLVMKKKPVASAASASPPAPSPSSASPTGAKPAAAAETKKRPAEEAVADVKKPPAGEEKAEDGEAAKKRKVDGAEGEKAA